MDGILIVNKPKNCTSNDIVNKVKKILNTKVGHTGTLDPNATGVLPLLLGKGTRFSKYLINHDKKYVATLQLGIRTSTADVEGDVIEEKFVDNSIFSEEILNQALNSFVGKQIQTPPIYSAIKVKGKKLYEYARSNIEIEIPKREIEIYNIELADFNIESNQIRFGVECSKGTYIRSLCEDIASKLNAVGYMKELQRVKVGDFKIEQAVTIDDIEKNINNEEWINKNIIKLEDLLKDNDKIIIHESDLEKFYNGVKISVNNGNGVCSVYCNGNFLGSGVVKDNKIKRDVIL